MGIRESRAARLIVLVASAATLTFVAPALAAADPLDEHESELYFVGFDSEVAEANGYDIRVIGGFEWSVPAGNAPTDTSGGVRGNYVASGPSPQSTIYGPCGYSTII